MGKGNSSRSGRANTSSRIEKLSDEQRNAVLHVLQSTDRVTAIRGGAGTGKTTMMKEAVAAIESGGAKVFTFAPSAEASRGVLRSDAGFANAETVEALLQNSKLQEQVRGQVIWIDEAGLVERSHPGAGGGLGRKGKLPDHSFRRHRATSGRRARRRAAAFWKNTPICRPRN